MLVLSAHSERILGMSVESLVYSVRRSGLEYFDVFQLREY